MKVHPDMCMKTKHRKSDILEYPEMFMKTRVLNGLKPCYPDMFMKINGTEAEKTEEHAERKLVSAHRHVRLGQDSAGRAGAASAGVGS